MTLSFITELDKQQKKDWQALIKRNRSLFIKPPSEIVETILATSSFPFSSQGVTEYITHVRLQCWEAYLKEELVFHKHMIALLLQQNEYAQTILTESIAEHLSASLPPSQTQLAKLIGHTAGYLTPYIYELCLSSTNSRRSRSGTIFEKIIEHLLKTCYGYPFSSQALLGTSFYTQHNLGKMVDGIIPNAEAFSKNKSQCVFVTMKTSLRERWQEVVEEIDRTNIPSVFLLTLDTSFSSENIQRMNHKNINLVIPRQAKESYLEFHNVHSFESFMNTIIPNYLRFWPEFA
ncbi:MAG: type II restriction endonuclease [Vampirovibrionales bacterium]